MGIPALGIFGVEQSAKLPSEIIENPQTIGEHLRNRRLQLKITQKSLGQRLGVSKDCMTWWENGRSHPHIRYYPKLIEFLGYNPFPIDDKSIGGQIKKYRIENGLSFRKLSKYTGFDQGTLSRWEDNMTIPNLDSAMKLVALNVIR